MLNFLRRPGEIPWVRILFFTVVGIVMLSTVYGLLLIVFRFFYRQPVIGPFLMSRMFSLAFLTFLFMLVYSNVMSSLSSHFLSKDINLLIGLPVGSSSIFFSRSIEAVIGSSWMVVLMCIPLYGAFGTIRHAEAHFYWMCVLATIPFLLIPAAASICFTTFLMYCFPARKMRELMILVGTVMFATAFVAFRLMEPEKLIISPDEEQMFQFLKELSAPSAPYLPSAWAGKAIVSAVNVGIDPLAYWRNVFLLWSTAIGAWVVLGSLASRMYRGAWSQATESMGVKRGIRLANRWMPDRTGPYMAIVSKDAKLFFREPAQWGQVLLLASLVLIYIFNLSRIPGDVARGLKSLLFFLNLGFIGLIMTAVAARFVFPMVSLEGGTFAVLRCSPISMEKYLWVRWVAGLTPLLAIALGLVGFSIPILGVDSYMSAIAVFSIFVITLAVSALAIGCGAAFAKFRISNPEQIVTSGGGFIFMALSALFITAVLVFEAHPVRRYYWAAIFNQPLPGLGNTILVVSVVIAATTAVVIASVKAGARSLERREI